MKTLLGLLLLSTALTSLPHAIAQENTAADELRCSLSLNTASRKLGTITSKKEVILQIVQKSSEAKIALNSRYSASIYIAEEDAYNKESRLFDVSIYDRNGKGITLKSSFELTNPAFAIANLSNSAYDTKGKSNPDVAGNDIVKSLLLSGDIAQGELVNFGVFCSSL